MQGPHEGERWAIRRGLWDPGNVGEFLCFFFRVSMREAQVVQSVPPHAPC